MPGKPDLCSAKWLNSQQVYCQLPQGHRLMHWSEAESDAGEDCELFWGQEAVDLGHAALQDGE